MAFKLNIEVVRVCIQFVMHVCNFVTAILEKVEVNHG